MDIMDIHGWIMMNHGPHYVTTFTKGLMDWSHARPRRPWTNFEKKQTNRRPNAWTLAHLSPLDCHLCSLTSAWHQLDPGTLWPWNTLNFPLSGENLSCTVTLCPSRETEKSQSISLFSKPKHLIPPKASHRWPAWWEHRNASWELPRPKAINSKISSVTLPTCLCTCCCY